MKKCVGCLKMKDESCFEVQNCDICQSCAVEIRNAFSYSIGGQEVIKQTFDRVKDRGYVIPEELEHKTDIEQIEEGLK